MIQLKGLFERKDNEIIGIASTGTVDRDGESINQNGWDLKNFLKNPVILAGHDWWSFPIGKATEIAVKDGQLMFSMVFATTEKGQEAYQLVKEGVLNAFSVGFMPKEWNPNDPDRIEKAELFEISLVSVPANPEAVVMAKGMKDNSLAQKMAEKAMENGKMKKSVEKLMTQEVEVASDMEVKCDCGMTYTLKLATHPEGTPIGADPEGNKGEDGEGRLDDLEPNSKKLIKGALKMLQTVQEIQNRKELK